MLDTSYSSLFIGDNLFSLMQKKERAKNKRRIGQQRYIAVTS
jgi:hypothetical protein